MDPQRSYRLALGYWSARALGAAAELGVLELLASAPRTVDELRTSLGLRSPSLVDLLDALVGLEVLVRDGPRYALAGPVAAEVGRLAGADAFRAWADLAEVLRAGDRSGPSMFQRLAADDDALDRFAEAMAAAAAPAHDGLVGRVDWTDARTVCDVGGADGRLAVALARRHPHLHVVTVDLPAMTSRAGVRIAAAGLDDRVSAVAADVLTDPLPGADVVICSLVLLDWAEQAKLALLRAARAALGPAGRLVVVDRLRSVDPAAPPRPTFELLRSLHLLVTEGEAHHYDLDQLAGWLAATGFAAPVVEDVDGGFTLAVASVLTG